MHFPNHSKSTTLSIILTYIISFFDIQVEIVIQKHNPLKPFRIFRIQNYMLEKFSLNLVDGFCYFIPRLQNTERPKKLIYKLNENMQYYTDVLDLLGIIW